MAILEDFRSLTPSQRNTVVASFLGWTLDATDFFILVFVVKDIAQEFNTDITSVTFAILLTLAMRPVGALLFGLAADRFGRRPVLMIDVLLYSILEFASGFAPSLTVLIILRALYGIAMGGEWGVGASLTMESIPERVRGTISGVLQAGYPTGYLIASIVYGLLFPLIGWRGMFMVGALPALLILYIRSNVEESPVFLQRPAHVRTAGMLAAVRGNIGLFIYAIILMTAFNFMSHGTQDLYPTMLQVQRHFSVQAVSIIAIVYNIGAIIGGIAFGSLSQRIGRRWAIVIAAVIALPIIPLWAYATTPAMLALGAFLMQFMVQGAWGVIPVHLNELSPDDVRGTFPGFVYQLGNLLASVNATMQATIAHANGDNFAYALAMTAAVVCVVVAVLTLVGPEAHNVTFGAKRQPAT